MSRELGLLPIVAYARSGALDHAWRLFREGGFEGVNDDPAVLSVRGRLLKDRALGAAGEARRRLYLEAAEAYAGAGALSGASYPLINAATLSLLAGRPEQARDLARKVLELGERGEDEAETPYYGAATRAEALLLLGDIPGARTAFTDAIALAPRAYEDHASTLRQFGLILGELGQDSSWLDACRPPRALHFAGHMALAADDAATRRKVEAILEQERIGSGFGALAAGADIVAAEAVLARGGELHVLLPAAADVFREASVARFGDNWTARFDKVMEQAASLRSMAREPGRPTGLSIRLAAEVAMGCAVMQADNLMTEAVQLVILDKSAAGDSDWVGARWAASGRRRHVIEAPRIRARTAASAIEASIAGDGLAALLRIEVAADGLGRTQLEVLDRLAAALRSGPAALVPPRWTGEAVFAAYENTAAAAAAALAALDAGGGSTLRIAGAYGLASRTEDPFGGPPHLAGPASRRVAAIAASVPPGAIHVGEDFAASLYAGPAAGRPRIERVGELEDDGEGPTPLYSLKRTA
jgi:hypothetical protein